MTTLADLPPECIEGIVEYLHPCRHLTRLWMIGNRTLQTRLFTLRRRTFHETSLQQRHLSSDLVSSFLIGRASTVETNWVAIERLAMRDEPTFDIYEFSLISTVSPKGPTTTRNVQILFDKLHKLEVLRLESCSLPWESLSVTLPPTITRLCLKDNVGIEKMMNLRTLPLTSLKIRIKSADESAMNFLVDNTWRDTLTALNLSGKCCEHELSFLIRILPKNLTKLKLECCVAAHDIGLVVSRSSSLTHLSIGSGWSIETPLPPTLTTFKTSRLTIQPWLKVADILGFLPPSLTWFSFGAMSFDFNELIDFLTPLVPRFGIDCVLKMTRSYYSARRRLRLGPIGNSSFERAVVAKLKSHGLSEHHLEWLSDFGMSPRSFVINEHAMARLINLMPTKADAAVLLHKPGVVTMPDEGCKFCTDHYSTVIKCLEWGLYDRLVLTNPIVPDLSEAALRHIRDIYLFHEDDARFEELLLRHPFPSVTYISIEFGLKYADHTQRLETLRILWRARHHLPRLENISLIGWAREEPMSSDLRLLMAEMRLYQVPNRSWMNYHVNPPRDWTP